MAQEKIRTNLFVNFFGKGWSALSALIVTPFYVRLLGIESYALIGFYTALTSFFYLFDLGMGDSLCRESARLHSEANQHQELRNTLRTLEILYWGFGALLTCCIFFLAPWISIKWFHSETAFSRNQLELILRLMGFSFFFQWPFLFYCKGLQGLQAHITQNMLLFSGSSLRYIGGISVLLLITPTIEVFFYWQVVFTCLQTVAARILIWKKLPALQKKACFSLDTLKRIWKFSLGMTAIGITIVVLGQADKIFISRLFPLKELGYYCLSFTIASSLFYLIQPLVMVFYPLFVHCVEKENEQTLKETYHRSCQLVMLVVCPFAFLLMMYAQPIVYLWTSDFQLAEHCAPIIACVSFGVLLNCCMHMPYYLQLAHGWTTLTIIQNIVSIAVLLPTLYVSSKFFGLIGAAAVYLILNLGFVLFSIPYMHQKLIKTEKFYWYRDDFMIPFLAALSPMLICFLTFGREAHVFLIALSYLLSLASIFLFTPLSRNWIQKKWAKSQP